MKTESAKAPLLAIVGRPNVGKSTLFNRLIGSRRAIVGDEPGITRDIVMVVDARTELASPDMELARLLRRLGKPLFLAVNKVDSLQMEAAAENFRTLGIAQLFPISAEHGTGTAELLDAVLQVVPAFNVKPEEAAPVAEDGEPQEETQPEPLETKVAIIGHPNVGKSTLLNALTGTSRAIVSPVAGTTRDAVDEVIEKNGKIYRFIDTAGIRRKGKTHLMAEKLSVVMARKHLEAADVALLILDATEGVNALDANVGGYAHESGRSVIIVVNKWDLVGPGRSDGKPPSDRKVYEAQVRRNLKFLEYAPIVFISANTGKNLDTLFKALELVAAERRKRIGTSQMNRFLETVDFERAGVPHRQKVRIFYMTQSHASPPTFILFTDKDVKLHFSYQRFLENQIRKAFGFVGTPLWIKNRARKKVELAKKKSRR